MRHDLLARAHDVQIERIAFVGVLGDEVAGLALIPLGGRIAVGAPPPGIAGQGDKIVQHGLEAVAAQALISYSFFNIFDGAVDASLMRMCGAHVDFPSCFMSYCTYCIARLGPQQFKLL